MQPIALAFAIVSGVLLAASCTTSPIEKAAGDPPGAIADCTAETAEPVTLTSIERKPERYLGRCLVVRAFFDGDELFSTAPAGKSNDDSVAVVGAYIDGKTLEAERVWQGRFIGVLADCRESERRAVAEVVSADNIVLDVWVLGCQRGQQVHLAGLQTMNLRPVR